jgi:hypothetical protein
VERHRRLLIAPYRNKGSIRQRDVPVQLRLDLNSDAALRGNLGEQLDDKARTTAQGFDLAAKDYIRGNLGCCRSRCSIVT